jgi:hypothetical protein
MTTTATIRFACSGTAGVLALGLTACGGATSAPETGGTPAATAPTSSQSGTAAGTSAPSGPARVSANTAPEDEIAAALESAGVSNPERWAEEVVEYRPYPADDPNLGKLREELAKYNPGQETTDKIVSVLEP